MMSKELSNFKTAFEVDKEPRTDLDAQGNHTHEISVYISAGLQQQMGIGSEQKQALEGRGKEGSWYPQKTMMEWLNEDQAGKYGALRPFQVAMANCVSQGFTLEAFTSWEKRSLQSLSQPGPQIYVPQMNAIEEYILEGNPLFTQQEAHHFLQLLEEDPILRDYVQWIYDALPLAFLQELSRAAYLVIRLHRAHHHLDWSPHFIRSCSDNPFFLCSFSDPAFQFFRIQIVPTFPNGGWAFLETPELAFIKTFIRIMLEVACHQPVEGEVDERIKKSRQLRKSKKICKSSP